MRRGLLRRARNERGAALLEMALTLPLLLLVCVGILEFGRAYQTWQVLTNAAREGARMAVIDGPTDADVRARVNSYLTGGGLTSLSADKILVNRTVPFNGTATASQVTVNYPFSFMVLNPVVRLVRPTSTLGGSITMSSATLMRNE